MSNILRLPHFLPSFSVYLILYHPGLSQERQFCPPHPQFIAEYLSIVLADQGGTLGDTPGGSVVDGRPTGVDEPASQLWVHDRGEKAPVVQMRIVDDFVHGAHPAPRQALLLPATPAVFLGDIG